MLHGLAMCLSRCLGRGVLGPEILIASAVEEPRCLRSLALVDMGLSYLSKTMSILLHPLSPSGADMMPKYLSASSPNVLAPPDFTIWTMAIASMMWAGNGHEGLFDYINLLNTWTLGTTRINFIQGSNVQ